MQTPGNNDLSQPLDIADVDVDELERRLEMSVGSGAIAPDWGVSVSVWT